MLSLSRKPGERIVIQFPGQPAITIAMGPTFGNRTQLHFDAPREVKIMRAENMPDRVEHVRRGQS